jgi:hypothetical protein
VTDLRFFGPLERDLRAQADGRTLDLGDLDPRRDVSALEELAAAGERFDSVVSIFQLSRFAQPLRAARAIEQLLADDGELFFLEPTASPGLVGLVQRWAGRRNHDIPGVLRDAGLSPRVCERITVNAALPAHMYVHGSAFRTLYPRQAKPAVVT